MKNKMPQPRGPATPARALAEAEEVASLRRHLRDLNALSGLSAVWGGQPPARIADNLADVLLHTLDLDFTYVRLQGRPGEAPLESSCMQGGPEPSERTRIISRALLPWMRPFNGTLSISLIPDPFGHGTVKLALVPIGYGGACGILAAGCRRLDFPGEFDRMLLWMGTNQAAVILQHMRAEEDLRETDRRKDEFLASLAHELRNPLAPLRSALQILQLGEGDGRDRAIGMMERQMQHLIRLVDDLLDVSRITRGKIELRKERVELSTIMRSALEASVPLLSQTRHELSVTLPPEPLVLDADPIRLAQVFSNLIDNAARYTAPGGHIEVKAERRGSELLVRVRDDGAGISRESLPRIFEAFVQAGPARPGGLGIGLTLVRSLVRLHGGTVEAHSDGLGRGSTFTIRLALAAERVDHDPIRPGPVRADNALDPLLGVYVLVVDDNRDAAESLAMLLRLRGCEVEVAYDAATALDSFRARVPDAAVLDIGLPGMDGYELARRVRADRDFRDVVLLALTGWDKEEDRRRSREAGFNHHLIKPVNCDDLVVLLRRSGSAPPRTD